MKIIWLGHGSFRIEVEQAVILLDPWTSGPTFPTDRDGALAGATHVLVTHGHGDHTADVPGIAQDLGVPVFCAPELAKLLGKAGVDAKGFGRGGTVDLGGAKVTMVPASHSSSYDRPDGAPYAGGEAGFVIAGDGHVLYASGDTGIMADMDWIGAYFGPDVGILSCGGHYTMDMKMAAWAAQRYFDFKVVIPAHYGTFPLLEQSADALIAGLPGVRVIEPEVMVPIAI